MGTAFSVIINFLSNPPGSLVYHLVTGCSLFLTGLLALIQLRRSTSGQRAKGVLIGCTILLLIQIVLIGIFTFNFEIFFNIPFLNANIERLTSALTVLWLTWTFLDVKKSKVLTGVTIFLTLALILVAGLLVLITNLPLEPSINTRVIDILWQIGSLLLLATGLTLLLFKRAHQWALGLTMLIVLAMGHITQIIIPDLPFSHLGAVRFAQTLCLPWILVLTQRFVGEGIRPWNGKYDADPEVASKYPLVDTKPKLMDLLLKINLQENTHEKHKTALKALSLSLVADICYLAYIPNINDSIQLIIGYDLIREEFLQPATLSRADFHHIMEAWEQKQTLILTQDDPITRDATVLSHLIKYHHIGNLLAYPLFLEDKTLIGGVLFLTPYTGKYWQERSTVLLSEIKDTLAKVLFTPDPQEILITKLAQAHMEIESLRKEKETYEQALTEKDSLLQHKEENLKQFKAKYQIEKFESVKTIDQLRSKLKEHTSQDTLLKKISVKLEQLTSEIRQLNTERDELKTMLSRTTAKIRNIENQTGQTGPIRLSMGSQIISLDSIAANVRLKIASQLQNKNLALEIINPDGRQMIKTDPELLQSITLGLLQNAITASKRKENIQFSQKLAFETGMLIIQVTDFGEGLTPAEQSAFFSAQYETVPGIGSIQSIREAIRGIRVLNGKIWLRSKKESFTTFRVQLPVRIID